MKANLVFRMPTRQSGGLLQGTDDGPFMNKKYCHNFLVFQFQ